MVSASDRAFLYGDGIFTTMKVTKGCIELWPLHQQRLLDSANRLGFATLDLPYIQTLLQQAITKQEQVLKLQVSRGEGGRGYSPAAVDGPRYYVSSAALPDYSNWQGGIVTDIANLQLGRQPLLAGIKHCSRLETVLLKQEAEQRGFSELLVCDSAGFVVEGVAANLFFYQQGQWYTPSVTFAGVAGVMRQLLVDKLAAHQVQWTVAQLAQVEAIALCSSLLGVIPIRQLGTRVLGCDAVEQVQQHLTQWVQEYNHSCGKNQ